MRIAVEVDCAQKHTDMFSSHQDRHQMRSPAFLF